MGARSDIRNDNDRKLLLRYYTTSKLKDEAHSQEQMQLFLKRSTFLMKHGQFKKDCKISGNSLKRINFSSWCRKQKRMDKKDVDFHKNHRSQNNQDRDKKWTMEVSCESSRSILWDLKSGMDCCLEKALLWYCIIMEEH